MRSEPSNWLADITYNVDSHKTLELVYAKYVLSKSELYLKTVATFVQKASSLVIGDKRAFYFDYSAQPIHFGHVHAFFFYASVVHMHDFVKCINGGN